MKVRKIIDNPDCGIDYDDFSVEITPNDITVWYWIDVGDGLTQTYESYPNLESFKEDWAVIDE